MGDLAFDTPARLGRFDVVRHLAMGGMAEVLLACARDPSGATRHVVLKRIRPDQARDHRFVRMFIDEARIAAMLDHPNIVRVFDIADDFFAMEYVHGEDLRRVLGEVCRRREKLPIALVTSLVSGAAAGLHHAHVQLGPDRKPLGIVHRDVSPANILVGYDGAVKVTDFGIAKAALRTIETRSGTLKGKVSYMSPEQVAGKEVDRRSDVFALGIVLYEVATARRLFKADNDFLTMSAIVQGDIPRPSELRPDLPRVLENIIMTALSGNPKDRFQTAEELRDELESFTNSLGMRMSGSSIADYMKKLFGRRAEPWLIDDEPTLLEGALTIDFDGAEAGVVHAPEVVIRSHAFPPALQAAPRSPIAFALESAGGAPVATALEPRDPTPHSHAPTSTGMAWVNEPSKVSPTRSRGRVIAMAFAAAAVAGAGMFGVLKLRGGSDADAGRVVRMTASPPAATDPKPVAKETSAAANAADPQVEPAKAAAAKIEAERLEAELAKSTAASARQAKLDAAKADEDRREATRLAALDAAKAEAAKLAADRAEAARAAKAEVAKLAADRAEAARAAKAEAAKLAADRVEAARVAKAEAAKANAAKANAKKAEAAKLAADRAETSRVAKAEAAKVNAAKKPPAKPPQKAGQGAWDPNALFAPK